MTGTSHDDTVDRRPGFVPFGRLPLVLQIAVLWLIGIAGFVVCVDQLFGHHAPLPGKVPIPSRDPFPAN